MVECSADFRFALEPRQSVGSLATAGGSAFRATVRLRLVSVAR